MTESDGGPIDRFGLREPSLVAQVLLPAPSISGYRVQAPFPSVDVWCLRTSDLPLSALTDLPRAGLLSESERERYGRFRFQKDRDAFLTKRLLVRAVLSQYASILPERWEFVENEFGHPTLAPACDECGLHFNLSRSGDLAVCAVSRGGRVGIDVEDAGRSEPIERVDWVLGRDEQLRINRLPEAERGVSFLRYWTLKEAYVKARGVGLSLPVAEIQFDFEQAGNIRVMLGASLNDDPGRWRFAQFTLFGRYIVAVAADAEV